MSLPKMWRGMNYRRVWRGRGRTIMSMDGADHAT